MTKILLIGAEGYLHSDERIQLTSHPWHRLSAIRNVAVFDEVIVNLVTLSVAKKLDLQAYENVFSIEHMGEILSHGGRIILLGDPRQQAFPSEVNHKETPFGRATQTRNAKWFLDWTRLGIQWDERTCTAVQLDYTDHVDRVAFDRYLATLDSSDYSLRTINPDLVAIADAFEFDSGVLSRNKWNLAVKVMSFCKSRYNTALAGKIVPLLVETAEPYLQSRSVNDTRVLASYGPIVFLPETRLTNDEALRMILEDAYGISLETEEPEWVQEVIAPRQKPVDDEITRLLEALQAAWTDHQERLAERAELRQILRLLYGHQMDLEVTVRDALRKLGAEIDEPIDKGKRDAWIKVNVDGEEQLAVLEVKSKKKGHFDINGLRQLYDWQLDGFSEFGIRAKQVFIGNASPLVPLEEREFPFGHNFDQQARAQGVIAFRSEDLYHVYRMVEDGELEASVFWKNLFTRSGAVHLVDLTT